MDKTESIATVDDAIKKLVLLDTKDKIWTQEMLLQVTDKAVRLLDCDTQVRPQICQHISRLCYHPINATFTVIEHNVFTSKEVLFHSHIEQPLV